MRRSDSNHQPRRPHFLRLKAQVDSADTAVAESVELSSPENRRRRKVDTACSQCDAIMSPVHEEDGKVLSLCCKHCGNVHFPEAPESSGEVVPADDSVAESEDRIVSMGGTISSCCPVCEGDQPLAKGKLENRPALFCETCLGVLISNARFTEVLDIRRSGRMRSDADTDPEPIDQSEYNRRIQCPNCSNMMDVHPYYGPGNVVIDSCCRCFLIWFDHGEIAKIERA